MRLQRVPEDPPPAEPPAAVVTIGNFDGVHRGHRYLIGRVIERAAALGALSAVVTFEPHPRLVLRPHEPLALLSTLEERADLLEQLGVDHLLVWRFDRETRDLTPEQFFERLNRHVRVRHLVHGPGFALGRQRAGTPDVIAAIGTRLGFGVEEVTALELSRITSDPQATGDERDGPASPAAAAPVSSGAIRALIEQGKITQAARALARPPTLTGVVIEGASLGRALGFPTANLRLDSPLAVPADGIYAAWAELQPHTPRAQQLPAAVSIGTRPTFGGRARAVEAHLLDFAGDLYGQKLRLHFVARLRGQERFDTPGALVAQMGRDVETTRALLFGHRRADAALLAADG
jgi:riboflavin kinase/FMN adenylyltransferase